MLRAVVWLVLATTAVLSEPHSYTPRCRGSSNCRHTGGSDSLFIYTVDGNKFVIDYLKHSMLRIFCFNTNVLESPSLPRADEPLFAPLVILMICPPTDGSLLDAFTAINIKIHNPDNRTEILNKLTLHYLPSAPPLSAKYFSGLESLLSLQVSTEDRASPEPGFLRDLKNLTSLVLKNVDLSANELGVPQYSLQELQLLYTNLERFPAAIYSMSRLRQLIIENERTLSLIFDKIPHDLRHLKLLSPETITNLTVTWKIETITLVNWASLVPQPLEQCNLLSLTLTAPAMTFLKDGWLTRCSNLARLVLEDAGGLTDLPTKLFNASSLTHLVVRKTALKSLPESLLADASELQVLELDGNHLQMLPSYTLAYVPKLARLNLSWNDLDGAVFDVVRPILALAELDVSHNPRLGDVCDSRGFSEIQNWNKLTKLVLSDTGVKRICRDWRSYLRQLEFLDLSRTNITELSLNDLQFTSQKMVTVWLLGTPLSRVRMTQKDFFEGRSTANFATIHIDGALQCDCKMYWVRRALEPAIKMLDHVRDLRCQDGRLLRELSLDDMVCDQPQECRAAALPAGCSCAIWAVDDPGHAPKLVRVRCENASLDRVPPLPRTGLYELHLAHNNITTLNANDLQQNIRGLDLRYNSLTRVDEETAMKLGWVEGVLQLAGNDLDCDCEAAPLLRAMQERVQHARDQQWEATCRNGSSVYEVSYVDCLLSRTSLVLWLVGSLVVVLSLALAILACLESRSRQFFVLAVLHRWGCAWRTSEPQEDDRRYDAFLTFSHKDEAVARELLTRLEPTYRLCVHYRDWVPETFIAEQVVASVRESRRTVALISRHFLDSAWARAEFREAHAAAMLDARPRLIVVLLEDPGTLPLDAQLQAYIRTNIYVRYDDPWFWEKLRLALPPPRLSPSSRLHSRASHNLPALAEPPIELSSLIQQPENR